MTYIRTLYDKKKEIFIAIIIFIFFFIILSLTPINGDDWGNYIIGMRGPRGWIGNAIGMYFDWEGRFISRILINMLTINKWLWNIINAGFLATLFLLVVKMIGHKKTTFVYIAFILSVLLIGKETFTQTYLWIAGNITYFFPLVLSVLYFYLIKCYLDGIINSKYIYGIWIVLNVIIPMFVETMGVVIIITNVIMLLYTSIKAKKINRLFLSSLLISVISFLSMILSPGTKARIMYESSNFIDMSLLDKIVMNIPNFIMYTIARNDIILALIPIAFVYLVWKNIKNKSIRFLSIIFNVIPYLAILLNLVNLPTLSNTNIAMVIKNLNFLYDMNIVMMVYWFIYLLLFFVLISIHFKNNYKVIFILAIGLISNGVMLISPIWGARTALFTTYMLLFTIMFVFNEFEGKIKGERLIKIMGTVSIVIISCMYIVLYMNVHHQNEIRGEDIRSQLKSQNKVIVFEQIPDYALWGINPYGEYHIKTFKAYYKIPQDTELVIQPTKYKYFIFYEN